VPTILEAAGIPAPTTVDGIAQKPIEGVSMAYTFDKRMPMHLRSGTRNISRCSPIAGSITMGWYACTTPPAPPWAMGTTKLPEVNDYKWELYNLTEDFSQSNDLAASNPDKLKELQALFLAEAAKYQVLPLDNSILPRLISARPSATAGRTSSRTRARMPASPSAKPRAS
jgi:arylsulfatase